MDFTMKIIQKISLLLALLVTTQSCDLFAPPGRGTGNSRNNTVQRNNNTVRNNQTLQRDANTTRSFGENNHQDAKGAAAFQNRNNQPQTGDNAGKAAVAGRAANNRYIDENTESYSDDYTNEETTTDSTSSQSIQPENEISDQSFMMNDEHQKLFDTTSTVKSEKIAFAPAHQNNMEQVTMQTSQEKYSTEHSSLMTPKMAIPDQNEILHKLKVINTINDKNTNLISESSLAQLFNNFVYFKNFIVSNFEKDKIMKLAQEFINQIYPQENISSITIATTNKSASTESSQKPTPVTPAPTATYQENTYEATPEANINMNEEQSYPDETFQEYNQDEFYQDDAILNEEEFEYVTDESFEE